MNRNKPTSVIENLDSGAIVRFLRERQKSGTHEVYRKVRMDKNHVHAAILHPDGSYTDIGLSNNLLTNIGRDVLLGTNYGFMAAGNTIASNISTAIGATSITGTGSVWTASNLATPQLGVAGMRVYASPHTTTNPIVYGNVISNTTNVLTIDKWWKLDDTTGTTPTNTDSFALFPGAVSSCRFIALTTDAGAVSALDTVLASEITNNGAGRALAAYAHTMGQATSTLSKSFSISGTITSIVKAGLFTALSSAGADPMVYETLLNQSATVGNGDTLSTTWTLTQSG